MRSFFLVALILGGFVGPAGANIGSADVVIVRSVTPAEEEGPEEYRRAVTGAGVGGTLGAIATRNSGGGDRAAAVALGALIGGAIGNRRDERARRIEGYDVIVEFDTGRLGAIFVTQPPSVGPGGYAYLVAGRRSGDEPRLIPAPTPEWVVESEEEPTPR